MKKKMFLIVAIIAMPFAVDCGGKTVGGSIATVRACANLSGACTMGDTCMTTELRNPGCLSSGPMPTSTECVCENGNYWECAGDDVACPMSCPTEINNGDRCSSTETCVIDRADRCSFGHASADCKCNGFTFFCVEYPCPSPPPCPDPSTISQFGNCVPTAGAPTCPSSLTYDDGCGDIENEMFVCVDGQYWNQLPNRDCEDAGPQIDAAVWDAESTNGDL